MNKTKKAITSNLNNSANGYKAGKKGNGKEYSMKELVEKTNKNSTQEKIYCHDIVIKVHHEK